MKHLPLAAGLLALSAVRPLGAQEPTPPRLQVQPEDVIATQTKRLGERELVIQKLAPRTLPPLPEAQSVAARSGKASGGSLQERQPAEQPTYVFVSATVHLFRQQPDKPRTLVRFWFTPDSEPVAMWTNANFLWLLGSFGALDAGGQRFNLLPTVSTEQWERPGATVMRHGRAYSAPETPAFADESTASFVVAEGSPTEEELAPLRALLAHYNAHRVQLKAAYDAGAALAAEEAQERADNPPEKKTLVLKYWRIDQAGQAGATSEPAAVR